jgi:hypothetical protein
MDDLKRQADRRDAELKRLEERIREIEKRAAAHGR